MYDMRGLSRNQCPECGFDLNDAAGRASSIPWEHRKGMLTVVALLKTVYFVTRHPQKLRVELAREVDHKSAMRFRTWAAVLLWLTFVAVALGFYLGDLLELEEGLFWLSQDRPAMIWVMGGYFLVAVGLFFYTAMGVHTYWFHPKTLPEVMRQKANALSYYIAAPLLLWGVMFAVYGLGFWVEASDLDDYDRGLVEKVLLVIGLSLVGLWLIPFALYVSNLVWLSLYLARRGWLGVFWVLAGTALSLLGLAALLFGVIPAVGFFLYGFFSTI